MKSWSEPWEEILDVKDSMNQEPETLSLVINVNSIVPFDQHVVPPLRRILEELANAAGLGGTTMCVNVNFLPLEFIGSAVNLLVGAEAYPPSEYKPSALVVPSVDHSGLTCTVFVDSQELEALSETSRPDKLVLSLLEEFLHARIYYQRWEQGGKVGGIAGADDPEEDIVASRVHDEYVVCRMKNEIVSTLALFDAPNNPGYRTTRVLHYGVSVGDLIEGAEMKLAEMQADYERGRLSLSQLKLYLGNIVFRQILDPLARSHAFFDGLVEQERENYALEQLAQPLFLDQVNPYWQRIYTYLNESYGDEFRYMSLTTKAISQEIRHLLNEVEAHVRFSETG